MSPPGLQGEPGRAKAKQGMTPLPTPMADEPLQVAIPELLFNKAGSVGAPLPSPSPSFLRTPAPGAAISPLAPSSSSITSSSSLSAAPESTFGASPSSGLDLTPFAKSFDRPSLLTLPEGPRLAHQRQAALETRSFEQGGAPFPGTFRGSHSLEASPKLAEASLRVGPRATALDFHWRQGSAPPPTMAHEGAPDSLPAQLPERTSPLPPVVLMLEFWRATIVSVEPGCLDPEMACSPAELVGRSLRAFVPSLTQSQWGAATASLARGEPLQELTLVFGDYPPLGIYRGSQARLSMAVVRSTPQERLLRGELHVLGRGMVAAGSGSKKLPEPADLPEAKELQGPESGTGRGGQARATSSLQAGSWEPSTIGQMSSATPTLPSLTTSPYGAADVPYSPSMMAHHWPAGPRPAAIAVDFPPRMDHTPLPSPRQPAGMWAPQGHNPSPRHSAGQAGNAAAWHSSSQGSPRLLTEAQLPGQGPARPVPAALPPLSPLSRARCHSARYESRDDLPPASQLQAPSAPVPAASQVATPRVEMFLPKSQSAKKQQEHSPAGEHSPIGASGHARSVSLQCSPRSAPSPRGQAPGIPPQGMQAWAPAHRTPILTVPGADAASPRVQQMVQPDKGEWAGAQWAGAPLSYPAGHQGAAPSMPHRGFAQHSAASPRNQASSPGGDRASPGREGASMEAARDTATGRALQGTRRPEEGMGQTVGGDQGTPRANLSGRRLEGPDAVSAWQEVEWLAQNLSLVGADEGNRGSLGRPAMAGEGFGTPNGMEEQDASKEQESGGAPLLRLERPSWLPRSKSLAGASVGRPSRPWNSPNERGDAALPSPPSLRPLNSTPSTNFTEKPTEPPRRELGEGEARPYPLLTKAKSISIHSSRPVRSFGSQTQLESLWAKDGASAAVVDQSAGRSTSMQSSETSGHIGQFGSQSPMESLWEEDGARTASVPCSVQSSISNSAETGAFAKTEAWSDLAPAGLENHRAQPALTPLLERLRAAGGRGNPLNRRNFQNSTLLAAPAHAPITDVLPPNLRTAHLPQHAGELPSVHHPLPAGFGPSAVFLAPAPSLPLSSPGSSSIRGYYAGAPHPHASTQDAQRPAVEGHAYGAPASHRPWNSVSLQSVGLGSDSLAAVQGSQHWHQWSRSADGLLSSPVTSIGQSGAGVPDWPSSSARQGAGWGMWAPAQQQADPIGQESSERLPVLQQIAQPMPNSALLLHPQTEDTQSDIEKEYPWYAGGGRADSVDTHLKDCSELSTSDGGILDSTTDPFGDIMQAPRFQRGSSGLSMHGQGTMEPHLQQRGSSELLDVLIVEPTGKSGPQRPTSGSSLLYIDIGSERSFEGGATMGTPSRLGEAGWGPAAIQNVNRTSRLIRSFRTETDQRTTESGGAQSQLLPSLTLSDPALEPSEGEADSDAGSVIIHATGNAAHRRHWEEASTASGDMYTVPSSAGDHGLHAGSGAPAGGPEDTSRDSSSTEEELRSAEDGNGHRAPWDPHITAALVSLSPRALHCPPHSELRGVAVGLEIAPSTRTGSGVGIASDVGATPGMGAASGIETASIVSPTSGISSSTAGRGAMLAIGAASGMRAASGVGTASSVDTASAVSPTLGNNSSTGRRSAGVDAVSSDVGDPAFASEMRRVASAKLSPPPVRKHRRALSLAPSAFARSGRLPAEEAGQGESVRETGRAGERQKGGSARHERPRLVARQREMPWKESSDDSPPEFVNVRRGRGAHGATGGGDDKWEAGVQLAATSAQSEQTHMPRALTVGALRRAAAALEPAPGHARTQLWVEALGEVPWGLVEECRERGPSPRLTEEGLLEARDQAKKARQSGRREGRGPRTKRTDINAPFQKEEQLIATEGTSVKEGRRSISESRRRHVDPLKVHRSPTFSRGIDRRKDSSAEDVVPPEGTAPSKKAAGNPGSQKEANEGQAATRRPSLRVSSKSFSKWSWWMG